MNLLMKRYERMGEKFDASIAVGQSLRVNTLKIKEKELIDRLSKKGVKLDKIDFLDFGYYYTSTFSLGSTPEFLLGLYHLQEAASQVPVQVLKPRSEDLVLDMAAAPGSKVTQIAQYMNNEGRIVAIDNNYARLKSLEVNLERLGVKNCIVYKKDAKHVSDFGIEFDKVLLDAPCSGNFCVNSNFFEERTVRDIKERAREQKELLKAGVKVLKKGGTLVYSTCSLEPEENEMVIDFILSTCNVTLEDTGLKIGDPGFTEVFGEKLNPEISKCRRFWPHKTGTEGFFVAKIRK